MNDNAIQFTGDDWPGNSEGQGNAHNPPGHEVHPGGGFHYGHEHPSVVPEPRETVLVLLGLSAILIWLSWKVKHDKL